MFCWVCDAGVRTVWNRFWNCLTCFGDILGYASLKPPWLTPDPNRVYVTSVPIVTRVHYNNLTELKVDMKSKLTPFTFLMHAPGRIGDVSPQPLSCHLESTFHDPINFCCIKLKPVPHICFHVDNLVSLEKPHFKSKMRTKNIGVLLSVIHVVVDTIWNERIFGHGFNGCNIRFILTRTLLSFCLYICLDVIWTDK